MTQQQNLELKGDFRAYPFAELLVEIKQAGLSGSMRASKGNEKCVFYFRDGAVIYAVSNSRELRLFNILLTRKRIDQKTLSQFPDLANDMELGQRLVQKEIFKKEELDEITIAQLEAIVVHTLTWNEGEWHFSPLARLRDDLVYQVDTDRLLVDYARCMPSDVIGYRFRSVEEALIPTSSRPTSIMLQAHETYVLDCFNDSKHTISELRPHCSLPDGGMLQALYVLWIGGFLVRRDWNAAFSTTKIEEIRSAKLSLIKSVTKVEKPEAKSTATDDAAKTAEATITLDEYLAQVENANTLYEVLGLEKKAQRGQIKNAYFAFAKLFHPDRFHREDAASLRRIQSAFTEIAHAYETLKSDDTRESYNLKMAKEAQFREKHKIAKPDEAASPEERQAEQGLQSFELAVEAMNEEEYAAAAGHFARAVHYSPQNALYHAYFGKALSYLDKQHHKAEAEMQAAVKLDPKNAKIRMMLVEFFVEMKMAKRAIGELNRLLEVIPGNSEAMRMLSKLQPTADVQ
ncbi:MAG TPA: DUF4388 domain-containing protein [Pyrinomonadaceae bacterium]|nr:DUF4388 domain-containing protein [Pyrinomonadaceae bacterium]